MSQNSEQWAIIELMGHQKVAGRYGEHGGLHRVDVPDGDSGFRFSRLYGNSAIYCITFVDEQAARMAAKALDIPPITVFSIERELKRLSQPPDSGGVIEAEYPDDELAWDTQDLEDGGDWF